MVCFWDSKAVRCDHFAGHQYFWIYAEEASAKSWLTIE